MNQINLKNDIFNSPEFLIKSKKKTKNKNCKFTIDSKNLIGLGKKRKKIERKNSLVDQTIKFIKYIQDLKNKIINLNDAARTLNIKKRRIYDITNIFEGKQYYI